MVQLVKMGFVSHVGGGGVVPPAGRGNGNDAVNFDGSTTVLERGADLTGNADGKNGIVSMWFQNLTDGTGSKILWRNGGGTFRFQVLLTTDNKLSCRLLNTSGVAGWQFTVDIVAEPSTNPGWHHLLFALDAANTDGLVFYDDAVPTLTGVGGPFDENVDFTGDDFTIGAGESAAAPFNGDMFDLYINTAEFLDISVEANRRKFITAGLKPVDLGADGSEPTGTAPIVFMSGAAADWATNKGTGGGFTLSGTLDKADNSPL